MEAHKARNGAKKKKAERKWPKREWRRREKDRSVRATRELTARV